MRSRGSYATSPPTLALSLPPFSEQRPRRRRGRELLLLAAEQRQVEGGAWNKSNGINYSADSSHSLPLELSAAKRLPTSNYRTRYTRHACVVCLFAGARPRPRCACTRARASHFFFVFFGGFTTPIA